MLCFCRGKYEAVPSRDGWRLCRIVEKPTKRGIKRQRKYTYHPDLFAVCKAVIDFEARECEDVEELLDLLVSVSRMLKIKAERIWVHAEPNFKRRR